MFSKRTFLIVLLVIFVIDMIQAGVIEDIGEAIHYDDIKKFTTNAAKKTGEAATNAFHTVKNYFNHIGDNNSTEGTTTAKPSS